MADDAPQSSGAGGTLKSKWGPLPVWGWLLLVTVAIGIYWLIASRKAKSSGSSAGSQGGPGAVGQPGVVVINQDDGGEGDTGPAPKGSKPPKPPESTRQITLTKDETLGQLAKQRHWSQETEQDVEQQNVTQGGGHWTPGTRLKKGQEVVRPLKGS
jgi:hypothetical protein